MCTRTEAPYRPPDDLIVTFPPSPVRLYIMRPDETEIAEDLGVQRERSATSPTRRTKRWDRGRPPRSLVGRQRRSLSNRPQRSLAGPRYPTGYAMEWNSEPSDDEEKTEQRF